VTLRIVDGYHVNANPATYDYLIATSVGFDGLTPTQVHYPVAILFKPAFAPAGLKVYEGEVTLSAFFPKGTIGKDLEIRAIVSTQACNSEICLPPAKLPVAVERDGPR
jgi:DsbC/DsbD-like thiol-disulfide interchange protein